MSLGEAAINEARGIGAQGGNLIPGGPVDGTLHLVADLVRGPVGPGQGDGISRRDLGLKIVRGGGYPGQRVRRAAGGLEARHRHGGVVHRPGGIVSAQDAGGPTLILDVRIGKEVDPWLIGAGIGHEIAKFTAEAIAMGIGRGTGAVGMFRIMSVTHEMTDLMGKAARAQASVADQGEGEGRQVAGNPVHEVTGTAIIAIGADEHDQISPVLVTQGMDLVQGIIAVGAQPGEGRGHGMGFNIIDLAHINQIEGDVDLAVEKGLVGGGNGLEDTTTDAGFTASIGLGLGRIDHHDIDDLAGNGRVVPWHRPIANGGVLAGGHRGGILGGELSEIDLAHRMGVVAAGHDLEQAASVSDGSRQGGTLAGEDHLAIGVILDMTDPGLAIRPRDQTIADGEQVDVFKQVEVEGIAVQGGKIDLRGTVAVGEGGERALGQGNLAIRRNF